MPTVEVFHDNSTAYLPGAIASREPGYLFAKVAEVEVSANDSIQRTLEEAFEKTQNKYRGETVRLWQQDPEIRVCNEDLAGPGFRSCRDGDWMRINGRVYRVAIFGFDEADTLPDLPRYSPHPAKTYDEEEPMNPEELDMPPELWPMVIPDMAPDPAEVLRLATLSDEELAKEVEAAMNAPSSGEGPAAGLRDMRPMYEQQLRSMLSAHERTERIASFRGHLK
jgi:hypothetical protein